MENNKSIDKKFMLLKFAVEFHNICFNAMHR